MALTSEDRDELMDHIKTARERLERSLALLEDGGDEHINAYDDIDSTISTLSDIEDSLGRLDEDADEDDVEMSEVG